MSDYIKRDDALNELKYADTPATMWCKDMILSLPADDVVERKVGRWIWDDEGYHCSECFFHAYGNTLECMDGTYAYCPNCGARMVI